LTKEDHSKMTFICSGFVGLFEWAFVTLDWKIQVLLIKGLWICFFMITWHHGRSLYRWHCCPIDWSKFLFSWFKTYIEKSLVKVKDEPTQMCFGVSTGKFFGFYYGWEWHRDSPNKIEVIQNVKAHILKRLRPFEM
jgi:hypothetical protein